MSLNVMAPPNDREATAPFPQIQEQQNQIWTKNDSLKITSLYTDHTKSRQAFPHSTLRRSSNQMITQDSVCLCPAFLEVRRELQLPSSRAAARSLRFPPPCLWGRRPPPSLLRESPPPGGGERRQRHGAGGAGAVDGGGRRCRMAFGSGGGGASR